MVFAQVPGNLEFMMEKLYGEYKKSRRQVSLKETEYVAAKSEARFEVRTNDDVEIKHDHHLSR